MGKLRFTLTFVLFWIIIVFSCLLAENFALLSNDHMGGMNMTSLYLLTFFILFMLGYYYFRERKYNQIKLDKVLLPIIAIFGLVSIATVWWQGPREFVNPDDGYSALISFNYKEKISYTLQILVWCAVLYGLLFVNNRYSISRKWLRWLPLVYVWGVLTCSIVDLFMEFQSIIGIFNGTYSGEGISFIVYNPNVWGHLLLVALLSCIILSIKKFNMTYYFVMIHLFIMIVFTSCSTAFFVGLAAIVAYSLFEIFALFNAQRRRSVRLFVIYLSSLGLFVIVFTLMVVLRVPLFNNFWSFVSREIFQKDYSTLTSRTSIWGAVIAMQSKNPADLIFGFGYKTGNAIFTKYFMTFYDHNFAIRSAHNGMFEILLRHGLFGLSIYLASFVVFVLGIIQLFKNKQYRVAFFYLICFNGLLIHGVAESTTFLTPNIGGTYATLVFFLPVLNETKKKYFAELNNDLQQTEIVEVKSERKDLLYFISILNIGLIIALSISLKINYLNRNLVTLIVYLVLISLSIVSLFIVPSIEASLSKISYKEAFVLLVIKPIKDHYIAIIGSLIAGLMFAFALPLMVRFDLFASLLYTLCIFTLFAFTFSLLHKKEDNPTIEAFNYQFTMLLRRISGEVPYEQK